MEIYEYIKTKPDTEVFSEILELCNERIAENKSKHLENFSEEFKILDRIITLHYFLIFSLKDYRISESNAGRIFLIENYINTIANNYFVIKELLANGLHIQFQLILRSQFEFVNNLIAFIGDDDFFQKFGKPQGKNGELMITPKPIHSEKSIKKLSQEFISSEFKKFWEIFKGMMNHFYSDLSECAHGNLFRVALQSLEETDDKNSLFTNFCGVTKPLESTTNILRESLNYFQIAYRLTWIQIEKKKMLDVECPYYPFLEKYSTKAQIIY